MNDKPMVIGELELKTDSPNTIAKAIQPDNPQNIKTSIETTKTNNKHKEGKVNIQFSFENIRQSIASLDDIYKCVDVAREVDKLWR
ncbi:Subunit of KEOPS complex, Pcc1 subunit [Methanonatronarchaeum thermophilum]|uniref:Subunit of KEOPS complex, Pcc1 subunit n=1 Tax=Methanonatronarchaeum thermophilum TaxID=1927129 RepID=A0A1Y3GB00_9EURY|nr:KEOPS complex subunit Pcc1 [Methanonatronarchaeum thermophilum]OUJ18631.1 Subunit of KEOPS complex, Pcc1 subunit [Methanonatronarchaeum thermophilum]